MTLSNQRVENEYGSPSLGKAKSFNWKWGKKYWLLAIGIGCLALFFWGSQITEFSLIKPVINCLPLIGGLAFAADSIIKLSKDV